MIIIENQVTQITNWTDIVAAIVVIYSAGLSTFNFMKSLDDDRTKVRVEFTFETSVRDPKNHPSICVMVNNIGKKNVYIALFGFQVKGEKTNYYFTGNSNELLKIEPGKTMHQSKLIEEVNRILKERNYSGNVEIRPFCKDSFQKIYPGKYLKYNTEKFEIPIKKNEVLL